MNYNLIFQIGALVVGLFTTWKIFVELPRGRYGHLRDEYRFAREFLDDLSKNPEMHPFLMQKGYQAIAGDNSLSSVEIAYLLTLHNSAKALKDFVLGRLYLEHLSTVNGFQIVFRKKFINPWARRWRKIVYLSAYTICFLVTFFPLILPSLQLLSAGNAFLIFAFCAVVFLPVGIWALWEGVRIARAEALVANQHKHMQNILRLS